MGAPDMIGVVGAGVMGAGIAQVVAAAGHPVLFFDAQPGLAEKAKERIATTLQKSVEKGRLGEEARASLLANIQPCTQISTLASAKLVIEAIIEDLPAKQRLFQELEALVASDVILATNTSSLAVTEIAAALARPARFAGLHFFNPAPLMPLVEVVSGETTAPAVLDTLEQLARAWGKSPVRCKDSPGFIVNRGARPFYNESLRFLEEGGADAATIDSLMRAAGFRMGPLELVDLVGLDVSLAVSRSIAQACGNDARYQPSRLIEEHVAAGHLGRKSGRGFYDYTGEPKPLAKVLVPGTSPVVVTAHGGLGPAHALLELWRAKGFDFLDQAGVDSCLEVAGVRVALTDGRTAAERAAEDGEEWVVFDLSLDYASGGHIALAASEGAMADVSIVAGLFQALGKKVSLVRDLPGLLVARTLTMLMNEAANTVGCGVAPAPDVDLAMRQGLNFPGGPLSWADNVGAGYAVKLIDHLAQRYGTERYRVSELLRQQARDGGKFHA